MKTGETMKMKASAITAAMLLALTAQTVSAADAVGYNVVTVPTNSDVLVSVPFNQQAVGSFTVVSVTGSGVTVADTLTANAYTNGYYVRFTTGGGEGLWSTISANGTGGFTLSDTAVLSYVTAGNEFRVYKHHTLASMFPKGMYGISYTNGTKVLVYENNRAVMGQNKTAAKTATYSATGGGRWTGSGVTTNTIIAPETQFIIRNVSATTLTLINQGIVPDYSVSTLIAANGDLVIGSGYPVPVLLKNSGLGGVNNRKVLFFDNSATGQNKSALKTATYSTTGGGRWTGSGVTTNELINPSAAVTFRLPSGETGTKVTLNKPY
jgi:uncharacterized protein (TIGR02597 family)